ncbi:unnamed protein product [Orchesella dallaii]|uniref:Transcription initiation factor TFIID subunit 12 n=1 Tax=Orchesella dallaii TaxID=48710 RepID=A0ABP1Q9F7_9HEXA
MKQKWDRYWTSTGANVDSRIWFFRNWIYGEVKVASEFYTPKVPENALSGAEVMEPDEAVYLAKPEAQLELSYKYFNEYRMANGIKRLSQKKSLKIAPVILVGLSISVLLLKVLQHTTITIFELAETFGDCKRSWHRAANQNNFTLKMASMNGPNNCHNNSTPPGGPSSSSPINASTSGGGQSQVQHPQAPNVILTRKCLQDLVKQVDPNEQLDEDVEDLLLGYADEFFEQIIEGACAVAAHRKASAVEVRDLQTYLERSSNIWVPGFGSDETKAYKRAPVTEAHKQRMALIKKQLKKY